MLALYVNFDRIIARLFIQAEQSRLNILTTENTECTEFFSQMWKNLFALSRTKYLMQNCMTFVRRHTRTISHGRGDPVGRPNTGHGQRTIDPQCLRAVIYRPYKSLELCCMTCLHVLLCLCGKLCVAAITQ